MLYFQWLLPRLDSPLVPTFGLRITSTLPNIATDLASSCNPEFLPPPTPPLPPRLLEVVVALPGNAAGLQLPIAGAKLRIFGVSGLLPVYPACRYGSLWFR